MMDYVNFKKRYKKYYYISYILFIISFIVLFILKWYLFWVYIFSFLYALWFWAFRNAVHTQELKNIEDKNRDFYSSSITAWKNLIDIFIPLLVAFIFFLSWIFYFDWYVILFFILPLIYIFSFVFINNIESYIPNRITKRNFINFFNFKKYKYWHLYFLIWWFNSGFSSVIPIVVSIYLLKNEVNIWLFQWLLSLISTFLIVHFSFKRNWKNRLKYFSIFSFLIFINFIIISFNFNLTYFIIFSLIWLFLLPLFRVSEHIYDLSLMDNIKTENSDFYPAMIMREIFLWVWRIWALLVLSIITKSNILNFDTTQTLKIWLLLIWVFYILSVISIYFWEKNEKI